jgi:hypothetical protein
LEKIRAIAKETRSLEYCGKEVAMFIQKAKETISCSRIKPQYIKMLKSYCEQILDLA